MFRPFDHRFSFCLNGSEFCDFPLGSRCMTLTHYSLYPGLFSSLILPCFKLNIFLFLSVEKHVLKYVTIKTSQSDPPSLLYVDPHLSPPFVVLCDVGEKKERHICITPCNPICMSIKFSSCLSLSSSHLFLSTFGKMHGCQFIMSLFCLSFSLIFYEGHHHALDFFFHLSLLVLFWGREDQIASASCILSLIIFSFQSMKSTFCIPFFESGIIKFFFGSQQKSRKRFPTLRILLLYILSISHRHRHYRHEHHRHPPYPDAYPGYDLYVYQLYVCCRASHLFLASLI